MRHYWVDRIEVEEAGVKGTGWKAVGSSEDFFSDHFPGNPVFPGIYLVEGMAQTAGAILGRASEWTEFALMVTVDRARFSSFARPGDLVEYRIELEERVGDLATVRAVAGAADRRIAQARLTFRILPIAEMIPSLHRDRWIHALSLLFDLEAVGEEKGVGEPEDRGLRDADDA